MGQSPGHPLKFLYTIATYPHPKHLQSLAPTSKTPSPMEKMYLDNNTASASTQNGQDKSSKIGPTKDAIEDMNKVMEHLGEVTDPTAGM